MILQLLLSYVGGITSVIGWGWFLKYVDARAWPSAVVVGGEVAHSTSTFVQLHSCSPTVAPPSTARSSKTVPVIHSYRNPWSTACSRSCYIVETRTTA